jgi:tetratricopeptide (TPR) repeat protein
MSSPDTGGGSLPLADLLEIDEACDRFEAAWRSGQRPALAVYLAEASAATRSRMLHELLVLELDYQFKVGVPPDPIAYRARYPEHRDIVDAVIAQFEPNATTQVASISMPAGNGSGDAAGDSKGDQATYPSVALPRADLSRDALLELRDAGYEILGELGRGGMGVVYLANKLVLNRRCALKMILAGAHLAPAASARFRGEAETIARLRHPGIVQIYHVGTVGGLPYFELEYLSGGSLDRRLDGTPWSAPVAAELVETLARAIAEAHRQGVVHRDLKPANILLDAELRPKVADFGLAKLVDSGGAITRTHTVLGSPSYMAPEQAQGHARGVGPTTDVYSLGAIFYELLTGRPPFRSATAVETLVQVRDCDPIPPSRFQPGLARAAETICLKCLEKAPGRRYPTADDLAEDLRRFRSGESILAHPAPVWEQAWRWTRRRPGAAAALGVGAAAFVLVLGGAAYYNTRLREAATKAQAAELTAVMQRNLALNAFNQLVFDVQERLGDTAATRAARRSLLNTAIKGLDDIAQGTEGTAPDLSRAVAHQKLGEIYLQIGRATEAGRQLDHARRLAVKLAAATPNDLAVAECLRDARAGLGAVCIHDRRYAEARDLLNSVVMLAEQIMQRAPRRAGARRGLLEAYLDLGRAHGFDGQHTESEACYQRMHDLAERWVDDEPANYAARDLLASSYRKLADERRIMGDHDAARAHYLKAIAIGHEVLAADPDNFIFKRHLATAVDDLAGVAQSQGQIAEARALFEEALRLLTEQAEADLEDLESQFRLIRVVLRLARLERDELQFDRAAALFSRALEERQRLNQKTHSGGTEAPRNQEIDLLKTEIAVCAVAPRALADLEFARARPPAEACLLLMIRFRTMAAQGRRPECLATAAALCDLAVDEASDLFLQAQTLVTCIRQLDDHRWTTPPEPERQTLRRRCADTAVAALNRSIDPGLDNLPASTLEDLFFPLRDHPGYRKLADRLRTPGPPLPQAQEPEREIR